MPFAVNAHEEIGPLLASLERDGMLPAVSKVVFVLKGFVLVRRLLEHVEQFDFRAFLLRRPRVLSMTIVHHVDALAAQEGPRSPRIIFDDAKQIRHAASWRACCLKTLQKFLDRLFLRHVCFFGSSGCFGDRVFDLEVVGVRGGPAESDLQGFVEFLERRVCGAGEGAEDLGVRDVVRTKMDFQEVVLAFADAFVCRPVRELAVFACYAN